MQLFFYLTTFSTPCMNHLLYLIFRCDRRCDEKFEILVGTKHTLEGKAGKETAAAARGRGREEAEHHSLRTECSQFLDARINPLWRFSLEILSMIGRERRGRPLLLTIRE